MSNKNKTGGRIEMVKNEVSKSALMMAYFRGYHAANVTPKIFDDYLANLLLPEEIRKNFDRVFLDGLRRFDPERAASFPDEAAALAWIMQYSPTPPAVLGRARYVEDSLEEAVRQRVRQYMILGAGLDTFAFRRPDLVEKLQVFEIDHPATQAYKRRRLADLEWKFPEQLHFIPVDFRQESLVEVFKKSSSYNQQALSLFSLLGVTYYLPCDAVMTTLRAISEVAPMGSTVIFDYLDTNAFNPEKAAPRVWEGIDLSRQTDEPMITGFNRSELAATLRNIGLSLHENLSPADIQERFFKGRTDGYYACEHMNYACAVVE